MAELAYLQKLIMLHLQNQYEKYSFQFYKMEYNLYNKSINNLKLSPLQKHSNAEFILYKDTFNSVNTSTARLVYVIDNNVSKDYSSVRV